MTRREGESPQVRNSKVLVVVWTLDVGRLVVASGVDGNHLGVGVIVCNIPCPIIGSNTTNIEDARSASASDASNCRLAEEFATVELLLGL